VISASVDDRKPNETHDNLPIRKSRYDSIDFYLHETSQKHNDINIAYNKSVYKTLRESGIDDILAKHVAHLWIRDPISQFANRIEFDDSKSSEHFENLQSTNWQTMRFKPPPPDSNIGWRVEFRPTEIQISDFENAAFVCFLVLTTRAILAYNLKTTIPISQVDENMQTAHKKDAVLNEKFHFKTNWYNQDISQSKIEKLTVNQIVNGVKIIDPKNPENSVVFKGLIPIIESYLADLDVDLATICTIDPYLKFVSKRASGEFKTNARWIRDFVMKHPSYKKDSVVSEEINYDLLKKDGCNWKRNML
jgi:glutamate--cysteine ligase catalytic subunit